MIELDIALLFALGSMNLGFEVRAMFRLLVSLALLVLLATLVTASADPAEKARVSQRVREACPVINLNDPKIVTFDVEGVARAGPVRMVFRGSQPDPQHFALQVSDSSGVPLIMYADGRMLIYDVQHGRMLDVHHATMSLEMGWAEHVCGGQGGAL